jgi:hypothetical protein
MSAALRRLAHQPNSDLAARAYCDAMNFALPGLLTREQVAGRLIAKSTLPSSDAQDALERGFAAAEWKFT